MREYGKVAPTFWTRGSGKALRGHQEGQLVAMYLFTAQGSNMIGLYYLALPTLAHETGLSVEGASKGLRRASEVGIAVYDEAAELVWVPEMARYQIGETVSPRDKRHGAIIREVTTFGKHPFVRGFFEKNRERFHLEIPDWVKALPSPFEGPPEPLRSQDQDQEQEQEQEQEGERAGPPPAAGMSDEEADLADDRTIASAILAALAEHESLRPIAEPQAARALAKLFGTRRVTNGWRFSWIVRSIGQAATDNALGRLAPEALLREVRKYVENSSAPRRRDDRQPAKPAQKIQYGQAALDAALASPVTPEERKRLREEREQSRQRAGDAPVFGRRPIVAEPPQPKVKEIP